MKISTKGRYALRLMLDLAYNHTGSFIPIKNYLPAAGYFRQISGTDHYPAEPRRTCQKRPRRPGRLYACQEPQEYTVGEILRLLEGNLAPVACVDDSKEACTRADECVTMEVWREIKDAVNKVVDNITLADLVEQQRQKCRCCK